MKIDPLIKMANQIADFFAGEGGPEDPVERVKLHLARYWEPRMRREIIGHYGRGGGGLNELALKGVGRLAADNAPKPAPITGGDAG